MHSDYFCYEKTGAVAFSVTNKNAKYMKKMFKLHIYVPDEIFNFLQCLTKVVLL